MSLFSSKISMNTMVVSCRQLAQTYDAGIPILKGIELATENTGDPKLRRVLLRMSHSIRTGATLGSAVDQERAHWPNLFVELVSAGEIGGQLKPILYELASYYEERVAIRRKVMTSLIYPALQVTVMALAISVLAAIKLMQKETDGQFDANLLMYKFGGLVLMEAVVLAGIVFAAAGGP